MKHAPYTATLPMSKNKGGCNTHRSQLGLNLQHLDHETCTLYHLTFNFKNKGGCNTHRSQLGLNLQHLDHETCTLYHLTFNFKNKGGCNTHRSQLDLNLQHPDHETCTLYHLTLNFINIYYKVKIKPTKVVQFELISPECTQTLYHFEWHPTIDKCWYWKCQLN